MRKEFLETKADAGKYSATAFGRISVQIIMKLRNLPNGGKEHNPLPLNVHNPPPPPVRIFEGGPGGNFF
jgi:hypothetical protein